jgi:hypothetical protein
MMSESHISQVLYFKRPGPKNTGAVISHAAKRAAELNIKKVLVATCSGSTAYAALDHFDQGRFEVIAVSHVTGFKEPDQQQMPEEVRSDLEAKGVKVLTTTHAFGGVGRGVRNKLSTFQVDEIMAFTLRMLGQGVKVGVEMAYMAADRGWVRTDEEVLTIGGTGRGADTAMIVKPAHASHCLELKVKEIIAKPFNP